MTMPAALPDTSRPLTRLSFYGSAGEYFGIWIVNILLSIVTLGIYSAWAKVRRMRYFYGNTNLFGHAFDYHATGGQIFLGRLIVFIGLVVINLFSQMSLIFAVIAPFLFLAAMPWLVKRSLRFNARVTSYRHVRFDFVGTTEGAYFAMLLGAVVATLSLGLLAPLASRWLWRYIVDNLRYGDRPFASDVALPALYRIWILPAVIGCLGGVLLLLVVLIPVLTGGPLASEALILPTLYAVMGCFAVMYQVYRIGVLNVVLSSTRLDGPTRCTATCPFCPSSGLSSRTPW